MKIGPNLPTATIRILIIGIVACAATTIGTVRAEVLEVVDDFSKPLAPEWATYAPLGEFLESPPIVEAADGVLTLSHPPSPFPGFAAVIGVDRTDVNWLEFEMSVEFSGWTVGETTSTGIWLHSRSYTGPDGLGNSYLLTLTPNGLGKEQEAGTPFDWDTAIMAIALSRDGVAVGDDLALMSIPDLDPTKWYRAVFKGRSNTEEYIPVWLHGRETLFEGWLYEVGQSKPLARLFTRVPENANFAGKVGFGSWDHAALTGFANNGVSVKFKNFESAGVPVTPVLQPSLTIDRSVRLSWPAASGPSTLESAASLDGPWETVSGFPPTVLGDQFQVVVPADQGNLFYRVNVQ